MKRLFSIILFFLFCTTVLRAEGGKIKGIHYVLDDSKMTASVVSTRDERHEKNNYKGKIIIPNTVKYKGNNYTVTEIKDDAFSGCYDLTDITIPNSVKKIGRYAFYKCYSLRKITLPNSLETIDDGAFNNCNGLQWTSIVIPNSVVKIGEFAFSNGVKSLIISANNPNYSFSDGILFDKNKTKLIECLENKEGEYIIPDGVKEIGHKAFLGCNGLTSVIIPNSVTTIGLAAFEKCTALTSITIPHNVISIDYSAFGECGQLTRVTIDSDSFMKQNRSGRSLMDCLVGIFGAQVKEYIIGEHVTAIGDYTFFRSENMTSVVIGDNVTSIGYRAFYGCTGLTSVVIPENVTTIGKGATFHDCTALKKVQWNARNCSLELYDDDNFLPPFSGSTSITEFCFGEKVKVIPECLCFNIKSLKSVNIPSSVTTIKQSAFRECSSLSSINIPNSVTEMKWCVFQDCINLISITLPNSIKYLYKTTFKGCTQLKEINYPRGLDVSKLEIPTTTKLVAYDY